MVPSVIAARRYFGIQSLAGGAWWILVVLSEDVRSWTLGDLPPGVVALPDLLLFVGTSALAAWAGHRWAAVVVAVWAAVVTVALFAYSMTTQLAGWGVVGMVGASVGSVAAAVTMWCGYLPTDWFFLGPFRFREAGTRSAGSNIGRSLAQLVVFWSTLLVGLPIAVSTIEQRLEIGWPGLQRPGVELVGWLLFACGSMLGLSACVSMAVLGRGTPLPADTARELVVRGPYRWVRNPMAVAGAAQTVGVGLVLGSWVVPVLAVVGGLFWDRIIRPVEEADLLDRFGGAYDTYRTSVTCWTPRFPRDSRGGTPG